MDYLHPENYACNCLREYANHTEEGKSKWAFILAIMENDAEKYVDDLDYHCSIIQVKESIAEWTVRDDEARAAYNAAKALDRGDVYRVLEGMEHLSWGELCALIGDVLPKAEEYLHAHHALTGE